MWVILFVFFVLLVRFTNVVIYCLRMLFRLNMGTLGSVKVERDETNVFFIPVMIKRWIMLQLVVLYVINYK